MSDGVRLDQTNAQSVLTHAIPEFEPVLKEHLADNEGELLMHVLFGDLTRFVIDAWQRREADLVTRCLGFLEEALVNGDPYVQNLVQVSFVENVGPWEAEVRDFISSWPQGLKAEARRQGWTAETTE